MTYILKDIVDLKRQIRLLKGLNAEKFWKLYCLEKGNIKFCQFALKNKNLTFRRIKQLVKDNQDNINYNNTIWVRLSLYNKLPVFNKYYWSSIAYNPNISLEFMDNILDNILDGGSRLPPNPNITEQYILQHPNRKCHWPSLARIKNISADSVT
jgi:hypothetical protein